MTNILKGQKNDEHTVVDKSNDDTNEFNSMTILKQTRFLVLQKIKTNASLDTTK